jgi:hypothetical protein
MAKLHEGEADLTLELRPPLSEAVGSELKQALLLVDWINAKLGGVEIKGDHRHRVPAQLFDLAIEHHAGITQLLAGRIYASAFALVRPEFECFVRGAWLHYCATDDELGRFLDQDVITLTFGQLITAVEEKPEFPKGILSGVKDAGWNAMNGYTHGGIHQVSRRMQGEYIEPDFADDALLEVIRFSGAVALLGLGQIASFAGRKDLWGEVDARLKDPPVGAAVSPIGDAT